MKKTILFPVLLFLPSLVFAQQVRITGISDFNFGSVLGGDVSDSDGVCIYSTGGNRYYVTVTGSGGGGAFELQSGGNSLGYLVDWAGSTGGFKALNAGQSKRYSGVNSSSETCGGSTNATIQISFTAADLDAAFPDSYSGTITILIEPA